MRTIIEGDNDDGDAEVEITDEGFDNPNYVTLVITYGEGEAKVVESVDVSLHDLSRAVSGFLSGRRTDDEPCDHEHWRCKRDGILCDRKQSPQ